MIFYEEMEEKEKKKLSKEERAKQRQKEQDELHEGLLLSEEDKGKYKTWFKAQMKSQTGKTSINSMSADEKKKFFDHIDANWEAEDEED